MTTLLWSPKNWEQIREHPELMYYASNRLRSVNNHELLKNRAGITSRLLGLDTIEVDFSDIDVIIFQKTIHSRKSIKKVRHDPGKLLVLDICDPISRDETRTLHHRFDLVICSSHELQEHLIHNGLDMPSETIVDPHEADPEFIKTHHDKHPPLITWYGISQNYPKTIAPLQNLLHKKDLSFRWTAEADSKWKDEYGFQSGIRWNLSLQEAWSHPDSWQHFIQSSDIGIAPVFDKVKSPHKILNYMAYGIPVVCTPTDAHKRIVTHGETGFFASTEHEWEKYLYLLIDPETRARIGANARKRVLGEFSANDIADSYLQTLIKHLEKKKSIDAQRGLLNGLRKFIRIPY